MIKMLIGKKTLMLLAPDKYGADAVSGNLTYLERDGVPSVNNRVTLLEQYTNRILDSVFTDKNGKFSFKHLDCRKNVFMLVSHDKNGNYNGVIADNIGGQNVDD